MFEKLFLYLSMDFVIYAVIVSTLIALCSSLLGVTLVLKRFSFIGDGLSHVAFGAIAIASVFNLTNEMLLVLPLTVISAILRLRTGQNARIKGDAAIAMISVGALAIGYLLMNLFAKSSNLSGDVCSTLFGSMSILTLSTGDVILCIVLSLIVVAFFVVFYHRIFSVTFDESFASATGIRCNLYKILLSIIIAVVIVLSMQLVGSLLISALIVFPVLSTERIFKSFLSVVIASGVVGVFCAVSGIIASIILSTPIGATVVCINVIVFAICVIVGKFFVKH